MSHAKENGGMREGVGPLRCHQQVRPNTKKKKELILVCRTHLGEEGCPRHPSLLPLPPRRLYVRQRRLLDVTQSPLIERLVFRDIQIFTLISACRYRSQRSQLLLLQGD